MCFFYVIIFSQFGPNSVTNRLDIRTIWTKKTIILLCRTHISATETFFLRQFCVTGRRKHIIVSLTKLWMQKEIFSFLQWKIGRKKMKNHFCIFWAHFSITFFQLNCEALRAMKFRWHWTLMLLPMMTSHWRMTSKSGKHNNET